MALPDWQMPARVAVGQGQQTAPTDPARIEALAKTGDELVLPPMQRLQFDSGADARAAYFARLEDLSQKGYLDATQD